MEDSQGNDSKVFSVRIVSIDYYMSPPIPNFDISYSSFQGGIVKEVPIVRIYGSTPAGQKTCVHVHRALPYLYIPCSDIPLQSNLEGHAYENAVALALEKALKLKGNAGSKRQHVHGCSVVRAKRFYGYYSSEELFVKIYLYYPHDVTRAANLLLGGVVFEKSLQPFESHIPFLLQFLVDYNLYGMGHMHLLKMRFRHPMVYDLRNADHVSPDAFKCRPSGSQADAIARVCTSALVWKASTIPDDWMWQYPGEPGASSNKVTDIVKRQSICELEGDTTVDDIWNQQYKMFTSLSQTRSDVRMVQSLVPIWEEEIERTGLHETDILADPGKPHPQDVLKTLLNGVEYEQTLRHICSSLLAIADEYVRDIMPAQCSIKDHSLVEMGTQSSDEQVLRSSEAVNIKQSVESQKNSADDDAVGKLSGERGGQDSKVADPDDIALLKWLASSQAVEEINSDDELHGDSILNPLIPAANIDKVLEKANVDYENESQQECQDILDSVEDVFHSIHKKERDSPIARCKLPRALSDEVIPQLDGAGDDEPLASAPKSSYKGTGTNLAPSIHHNKPHDSSSLVNKRKRHDLQWGLLPFSAAQEVNSDTHSGSGSMNVHDNWDNLTENDALVALKSCDGQDCRDISFKSSDDADSSVIGSGTLKSCSVRDLMRKRRCFRVESSGQDRRELDQRVESEKWVSVSKKLDFSMEPSEERNMQPAEISASVQELERQTELCAPELSGSTCSLGGAEKQDFVNSCENHKEKKLHFAPTLKCSRSYVSRSDWSANKTCLSSKDSVFIADQLCPNSASCSNFSLHMKGKQKICSNDDYASKVGNNSDSCAHLGPEMVSENIEGMGPTHTQFNKVGTAERYASSSVEPKSTLGMEEEEEPSPYFCMTFHKKPPVIRWKNDTSENAKLLPVLSNLPSPGDSSNEETSAQVGALEDVRPFFPGSCGNVCQQSHGDDLSRKLSLGVPTHYYNDGSYAYLLTPAFSPPSADSVYKWMASKDKDDTCKKPVPESCQVSALDPINSQLDQAHGDVNVKGCPFSAELKTCLDERSPRETKEGTKFSQDISQISGPSRPSQNTPLSQTGFRDPASVGAGQQLTMLSLEVLAESRGDLRPDPHHDPINIVVLVMQNDSSSSVEICVLLRDTDKNHRSFDGISGCEVLVYPEEMGLLDQLIHITRSIDPDILMGWDVQGSSLGFLAERAAHLGVGLLNKISRIPSESKTVKREFDASEKRSSDAVSSESLASDTVVHDNTIIEDEWGRTHASGVHVAGRIVLNVWRLVRSEVKLNIYNIEAVAEAVLRRKVPSIHWKILNQWFSTGSGRARYRCIDYMVERAKLNLEIVNKLDMINRTSELARVFGIDFFSVLSRGSQYRVESMLIRLAHTQNYVLISPGYQQVASQPAMECLPLVMEPESGFYSDPVVVLDFQSLYPSMIIAYNLCFCTCLGNVVPSKVNTLGVSSYSPDLAILKNLYQQILVTPNGVMYVPSEVRRGILPRLLEEILSTRIMVKQTMKKLAPEQQILHRIFNARQLALKLIANVTYGYTAAGFSGRMPCAELADSIVQCGRRTLEHAISIVNTHDHWNARVIYGDTDSMFVLLKGRTVEEAFKIGHEIASTITAINPNPVTLKMEKVYKSCFLLTKKRYVGYSYESLGQVEPIFDAKGIETVRRDTCGAVAKMMEKCLRKFFEYQDISKVRAYLQRQWSRILTGRVSLKDFIFAKEVRLGTYSTRDSSLLPPAAIVASKAIRHDPRAEPRYAERVPYVVVHGEPGARLVDMVVDPQELLAIDSPYRLNDVYYITKQIIPALQRVFGLVGADLSQWFREMPRPARDAPTKHHFNAMNSTRARIDHYYSSRHCVLCGELIQGGNHLCEKCSENGPVTAAAMTGITSKLEREIQHLVAICRYCGGGDWLVESGVKCTSLACSVYYERRKAQKELQAFSAIATKAGFYPKCMVEWF